MARLLLVVLFLAFVALAANACNRAFRLVTSTDMGADMPKSFQTIAYVVLIMLMFGVVTGWLGGI